MLARTPTAAPKAAVSAAAMGARQREISVSEFLCGPVCVMQLLLCRIAYFPESIRLSAKIAQVFFIEHCSIQTSEDVLLPMCSKREEIKERRANQVTQGAQVMPVDLRKALAFTVCRTVHHPASELIASTHEVKDIFAGRSIAIQCCHS